MTFVKGQISNFKGKKHTDKAKQKNREKHIGKLLGNQNGFTKGQVAWNKGKKSPWTSERNERLNKINFSGSKSHFWKGGITPKNHLIRNSIENITWRKFCLERDNFICQKTGQRGGNLIVHHINNFADFPELRFAIDNGITLSEKSHKQFHKKYGFRNNTREQLLEFFGAEA